MEAISLAKVAGKPHKTRRSQYVSFWQTPDTIAFVVRGREGRREFHKDPVDEVMYMIKGDMNLHYLTPAGEEKIAIVKEGEMIYCPAGTPHSPRLPVDAFLLVMERERRPNEVDRFIFNCQRCGAELFELAKHIPKYHDNLLRNVYDEFYNAADLTCRKCGHTDPGRPAQPI